MSFEEMNFRAEIKFAKIDTGCWKKLNGWNIAVEVCNRGVSFGQSGE